MRHSVLAFYKGRYDLFFDLSQNPDYELFPESDKIVLEEMFNKVINEGLTPKLVVSEKDKNCFNLDEAIRYLSEPLKIIVENSNNDAHFVNAIMKCFDGEKFIKDRKNGWIKFENAGGTTNIINACGELLKMFRSLPKPNKLYLRAFAIIDCDRIHPTMPLSIEKEKVINFLNENDIPYHVLEKREMENYLPDEVIDTIVDSREFVEAYLRLSPIQKDFFDLEKGFKNKNFNDLNSEVKNLYNDLSDEDKKVFRKNSLEGYPNEGNSFKVEFPRLFSDKLATKETLLRRCEHHNREEKNIHPYNPNELPDLVKRIVELL